MVNCLAQLAIFLALQPQDHSGAIDYPEFQKLLSALIKAVAVLSLLLGGECQTDQPMGEHTSDWSLDVHIGGPTLTYSRVFMRIDFTVHTFWCNPMLENTFGTEKVAKWHPKNQKTCKRDFGLKFSFCVFLFFGLKSWNNENTCFFCKWRSWEDGQRMHAIFLLFFGETSYKKLKLELQTIETRSVFAHDFSGCCRWSPGLQRGAYQGVNHKQPQNYGISARLKTLRR